VNVKINCCILSPVSYIITVFKNCR